MNATTIKLIDGKIEELKKDIAAMKTSNDVTKNTRGTQLYKMGRDRRVLCLIKALIAQLPTDVKLTDADKDTLVLLTTLKAERAAFTKIEVAEGDVFLDVLKKYSDRKTHSIMNAVEKAGLKVDYTTGKLVRA